jgi:hypothetical protein
MKYLSIVSSKNIKVSIHQKQVDTAHKQPNQIYVYFIWETRESDFNNLEEPANFAPFRCHIMAPTACMTSEMSLEGKNVASCLPLHVE